MEYAPITADAFAVLDGLDDWRVVLGAIHAHFRAGSFAVAAALVSAMAEAADAADHHPDIDLRYPDHVCVMLRTHAADGLTTRDVAVARQFSVIAARVGAVSEPTETARVEIAIDTMDADRIRPFWAAVLGYRDDGGSLFDPLRIGPPVWFQRMTESRTDRDRFHIDVSVPHDTASARIAAALAAGGTLVTDRFARSWWVLADADGNEACISTWQDRAS